MEETETAENNKLPTVQEMTPVIVENPFLVAITKKIARIAFITNCVCLLNTTLLLIIFAVSYGNQNQIYQETKAAQEVQAAIVVEAVKEETQAAVEEANKGLHEKSKQQSESAMRQLQALTNAAKQPKVVKK